MKSCVLCKYFGKRSSSSAKYRNINREQALTLYQNFQENNAYGKLIYGSCRVNTLSQLIDLSKVQEHKKSFTWLKSLDNNEPLSEEETESEGEYVPLGEEERENESREKTRRSLLNELLKACGHSTNVWVTDDFSSLKGQVRVNFLSRAKSIVQSLFSLLIRKSSEQFFKEFCSSYASQEKCLIDGNFCTAMRGISEAYSNADHWTTRREILSLVATKLSYSLIQSFIPGISLYRFTAARLHAATFGVGTAIETAPVTVQRFSNEQIEHFLDFITSDHVCIDMPFGDQKLKTFEGGYIFVPNTIRNLGKTRIIQQYNSYTLETDPAFVSLGDKSLYKLLDICKASERKSLQGLKLFCC